MTNKYIQTDKGEDALIHKHKLDDIWNSEYVRTRRKQILNGEWPSDCWYCERQEDKSLHSPRQQYNKSWMSPEIAKRVEEARLNDGHVTAPPSSLEPRPGILCNLKCSMCWSMSSSKIFKERKDFIESKDATPYLKKFWKYEVEQAEVSDFTWGDQEQYVENFNKCAPYLKRLYFTGGEPFMLKSNFARLQHLIDIGHTDLVVSLTTNLTLWNQKYLDILSRFKKVELTVSIDAYGEVNSYVRGPSEWKTVEENFIRYLKEFPHFYPAIICTVQNVTVFGVLQMMRWLTTLPSKNPINLILTEIQGPACMQPRVLPDNIKARFREEALKLMADESVPKVYRDKIPMLMAWVETPCPDLYERTRELREYSLFSQKTNKIRLEDVFPEFHDFVFSTEYAAPINTADEPTCEEAAL